MFIATESYNQFWWLEIEKFEIGEFVGDFTKKFVTRMDSMPYEISKAVDDDIHTIDTYYRCIYRFLWKTFDTIDHGIMLQKLYHFGFKGVSNEWFCNYLSNRKQFIH